MKLILFLFTVTTSFQLLAQKIPNCVEASQGLGLGQPNSGLQSLNSSNIDNNSSFQSRLSRAGGWTGNGGDFSEVNDNIWFIGNKTINYCIIPSDQFILSKSEIENILLSSFNKWKDFFKKYDLLKPLTARRLGSNRQSSISFLDGIERGANFNFKINSDCKKSDLKFFFGVENKIIKEYKKFETEHPYGFAIRKTYDHEKFLNTGLIWIKNVNNKSHVEHTLLHELGHVFGMKHDSVYIMRSSMAVEMESQKSIFLKNEIESKSWPYRFTRGSSLKLSPVRPKGMRRNRCSTASSFQAARTSKFYSSLIQVKQSDCLLVNIKSLGKVDKRGVMFELSIDNLTTQAHTLLKGYFKSKRKILAKNKGPGVFTQLLKQNIRRPMSKKVVWKKLYLDKKENYELSGSFKVKDKVIPAKLIQDKGATLDLYIPGDDVWLTLKSSNKRIISEPQ